MKLDIDPELWRPLELSDLTHNEATLLKCLKFTTNLFPGVTVGGMALTNPYYGAAAAIDYIAMQTAMQGLKLSYQSRHGKDSMLVVPRAVDMMGVITTIPDQIYVANRR